MRNDANDSVSLGLPRRVAITGGASGIGLACAELFLSAGSDVALIARSQAKLEAAAATLPAESRDRVVLAAADVTDEAAMQAAMTRIADELGGIEGLVLSAGISGQVGVPIAESTVEGFREVLDINVVGAFIAAKAALPHLIRHEHATITILGSDSGFVAVPGMVGYNASKGAIVQLTRALAVELYEDHGIRVNSVAPSMVDTPMARGDLGDEVIDNPDFPLQTAEDVAWSVAYLSSRRAGAVNGQTLLSDFGYTGRSSFPA